MSLLLALAATPGMLGTQEAIRQGQQKERREEHRARRCNIVATCIKSSVRASEINGRPIVLRDGALYVDTCTDDETSNGHLFSGYYLPYPESQHEGLVTTITNEAPILNWVYIDAQNCQLRYGIRKDAQPNLTGPFDCTRQDRRLTFQGWEGFCAVETEPNVWGVFFDVEDDGFQGRIKAGTLPAGLRILEIELRRIENRHKKDPTARNEDQSVNRGKELKSDYSEVIHEATTTATAQSDKGKAMANTSNYTNSMGDGPSHKPDVATSPVATVNPDLPSFATVPWPSVAKNTVRTPGKGRTPEVSTRKRSMSVGQGPSLKDRQDSVHRRNSSEPAEVRSTEIKIKESIRSPLQRSPTIVHVEPPVIISTHQMRPQRPDHARPPQASRRFTDSSENRPQTNEADTDTQVNRTSNELSSIPVSSPVSATSSENQPLSKARSILKRLETRISVRRSSEETKSSSKNKFEVGKEKGESVKSVSTEETDGSSARGRSRQGKVETPTKPDVMYPRPSHQWDQESSNSAISRVRRSLSVVRRSGLWGAQKNGNGN